MTSICAYNMFWKKKIGVFNKSAAGYVDFATDRVLNSLADYYRKFYEEHKSLIPRLEQLEAENKRLEESIRGILNYFQIDLTPDLNNCYKRRKIKKSDFKSIKPLN